MTTVPLPAEELLSEKVCFRIDPAFNAKHVLPLLAALQAYVRDCKNKTDSWNKMYKQNRRHELTLTLCCDRRDVLDFLYTWINAEGLILKKLAYTVDGETLKSIGVYLDAFDYYVDITLAKALDISRAGNLHLHQAIGIMIGANTQALPDLTKDSVTIGGKLVIVEGSWYTFDFTADVYDFMKSKFSEVHYVSTLVNEVSNENIDFIRDAEAVIGHRSFLVYAASCLSKPTLELVSPRQNFALLSQWTNPYYVPVVLDHPRNLMKGVERLWAMVTLCRDNLTKTAQGTSSVSSADDL